MVPQLFLSQLTRPHANFIYIWNPLIFFFQAEDGIRDHCVTGVQTCALVCRLVLGSEEHTSELQSHSDLVCRLLLGKKNKKYEIQLHRVCILRYVLRK